MTQRSLYLTDSSLLEVNTTIAAIRDIPDGLALALLDNLYRPSGGGEPADRGTILLDTGISVPIRRVEKTEGQTWIVIAQQPQKVTVDMPVTTQLDGELRNRKRRLHTLIHTTLAVAVRKFPDLLVEAADISPEGANATIHASWTREVTCQDVADIDRSVRNITLQERAVSIVKARSLEHAQVLYKDTFRVSGRHQLSGRIRLIVIDDLDANPCSGTHFETTNIGHYTMKSTPTKGPSGSFVLDLNLSNCWMYWSV